MAEQNSKLNNISVFKFFEMTLDEFKNSYADLSDVAKKTLDESICFIHPKVGPGEKDQGNGYMYAHGKYYTMSLDAYDLQKVMTTGDEEDIDVEVVRKTNLTPMDRIRLKNSAIEWIEIATNNPPLGSTTVDSNPPDDVPSNISPIVDDTITGEDNSQNDDQTEEDQSPDEQQNDNTLDE